MFLSEELLRIAGKQYTLPKIDRNLRMQSGKEIDDQTCHRGVFGSKATTFYSS
jgi:hypothetical protein